MNKQNLMQYEWDKLMSKLDKMEDVVAAARSHHCSTKRLKEHGFPPACGICKTLRIFDKAMEE